MRKSLLHLIALALVAMGLVACSTKNSCDSSAVKNALAESIKQTVGNNAKINYDSFVKIPIESGDYMLHIGNLTKDTTFICEVDTTIDLKNNLIFRDSIKYAPQYDYNKKLYIKLIEPSSISKNKVTNLINVVNIARFDLMEAQKAIVAIVFANNIDTAQPQAPNGELWGEWIMKVAKLNPKKWKAIGNGIYPIDRMNEVVCVDYDDNYQKLPPILWINTKTGDMHFNPSKFVKNNIGEPTLADFCLILKESFSGYFKKFGYWPKDDDRIVPLKLNELNIK